MPTSFSYTKTKKYSLRALALICILFIVTAPIGIWLLVLSFRSIEISDSQIQIKPVGKSFKFNEIDRYGLCKMKDLIQGFHGLNTTPTPVHQTSYVLILQNKEGKRIRIGLLDYPKDLQSALESKLKRKPELMERKGFLKVRAGFID